MKDKEMVFNGSRIVFRDCNERIAEDVMPTEDSDSPEAHAHDKKLTDADRAGVTSIKPRRSHRMRWNHSE
jgi:hypothetical protein